MPLFIDVLAVRDPMVAELEQVFALTLLNRITYLLLNVISLYTVYYLPMCQRLIIAKSVINN